MTQPHRVLILGGGIAGMSAAKMLAAADLMVHLVEKETRIGGKAGQWACMATDHCQNCGACLSAELADQTHRLPNVSLHTQTSVSQIVRISDGFTATLTGKTSTELNVDAVLLATGFELFDPTGFQSLGYGRLPGVITTAQLNGALKDGTLPQLLPEASEPAIAFIQCVGSRNREIGRDYCSQVCCKTALRQADKLLHLIPAAHISIFHMDLQIIGKEFRTQSCGLAQRVNLLQGVPAEILTGRSENKLTVIGEDVESGSRKAHHFDLVVLAVGMGPPKESLELMKTLGLSVADWGFAKNQDQTAHQGIYLAGTVQAPMDILSSQAQAAASANQIIHDLIDYGSSSKIAVLGRGIEGRTAALALAEHNFSTLFIDQGQNTPAMPEKITHFPQSTLKSIQGFFGNFHLEFERFQEDQSVAVDAVVIADGTEKTAPKVTATLKDIKSESSVISLSDFEARIKADRSEAPSNIVFWIDHSLPEWKENCRKVLTLADKLAEQKKSVTILMEKMLVNGLYGQRRYDQARAKGVKFLRVVQANQPMIGQTDTGLTITIKEATLPTVDLEIHSDLLVISDQITPRKETPVLSEKLNIACDKEGFLQPANVRHRPVGSPRKGIFFVGSCHDETDAADLAQEINNVRAELMLLNGGALKGENAPQIKEGHCVRCLTCLRICPHGAITLTAFRQPAIVPQACFNCGLCVANCPAEAIDPLKIPLPQSAAQSPPHTVVFACERSGALAAGEAHQMGFIGQEEIEVTPVSCAARINVETLLQPLVNGSKRVMIATCHAGNCRSTVGPENAAAKVTRIFTETCLPATMLSYHSIAANEPAAFAALINEDRSDKKGETQ